MVLPTHQQLQNSLNITNNEIEIIGNEQTAYRRFAVQLKNIGAMTNSPIATNGVDTMYAKATNNVSATESLQEARNAYRDTVMSTPHYVSEYDESLKEHVTAEFTPTIATQFVDGTTLTPLLKKSLIDGATDAVGRRRECLKSLKAEAESLQHCLHRLDNIQGRLNTVHSRLRSDPTIAMRSEIVDRLDGLENECESLLMRRQSDINGRPGNLHMRTDIRFDQYLYDDLNGNHPALAAILECLNTIQACREQCSQ